MNRSSTRCSLRSLLRSGIAAALLAVGLAPAASAQMYTNPASIGIPDVGNATLYPSPITVGGGPTSIGSIKVTLRNVSHGWPRTCNMVLQAPNGQAVLLTDGTGGTTAVSGLEFSFGQPQTASTTPPTPWVTGTFLPVGPWGGILGSNSNGLWRLYVHQNFGAAGVGGNIQGGWSLTLGSDKGQINVDFNSGGSPTQTGPGLVGVAGDTWNAMPAHPGSEPAHALVTSFNAATTVTLAYSGASDAYDDSNNSFNATPFANLMRDYLYVGASNTATFTFAGLTPNALYDLVLYSNANLDRTRASRFTVNGVSKVASSTGTANAFIPGNNYVRFPATQADGSGGLAVALSLDPSGFWPEANINGLQIQPAPLTIPGEYCSSPTPIVNGTIAFTTAGSTTDGPSEANLGFCCNELQINQDVWFLYTASCTGTVTVNLCTSSFDTKVAIYNGATCPTAPNTAIAGNDDSCGVRSQTSFAAVAGHPYLVRVGGYTTGQGSVQMTITCDGSACLAADMGVQGGIAGRDGVLDNNDFIAYIDAFFNQTACP